MLQFFLFLILNLYGKFKIYLTLQSIMKSYICNIFIVIVDSDNLRN